MSSPLGCAVGERLEIPAYYADFQENYARTAEFWKLERGQAYAEPGNASWEAFDDGNWAESMRLLEKSRDDLIDYFRECSARKMVSRRIRIPAIPPTGYLQWELSVLRLRDELGGPVRILLDTDVADLEVKGTLPDIYTMDNNVMYQAVYDGSGVLEYALKYTDRELIESSRNFIAMLFARGEPIATFFAREIAPLPPPRPGAPVIPRDYLERVSRPRPIRS